MRPEAEYQEALRWIAWGLNDSEVGRMTGIPPRTIRKWRQALGNAFGTRTIYTGQNERSHRPRNDCPRCDQVHLPDAEYAYLLGLYLGDGHLVRSKKDVYVLRIVQDARYPRLVELCAETMRAMRQKGIMKASFVERQGCVVVQASWKHWPCLFPQHDAGKKHHREIVLAPWQKELVDRCPEQFLRGLIHSDGWRGVNRVQERRYAYPRYQFSNRSADIRRLFCDACEGLGVTWRQMNRHVISVARRDDVALLDSFIEPKG